MKKVNKIFHPSTMANICGLYQWWYYRGKGKGVIPPEATQSGLELEQKVQTAIDSGRNNYEIDEHIIKLPESLMVKAAQFQYSIRYKIIKPDCTISGKADWINFEADKVTIIDYKQRFSPIVIPSDEVQLRYYAYDFIRQNKNVSTAIYFIRFGLLYPVHDLSPLDLPKLEKEIIQECENLIKVIESKKPRAKVSWFCVYCPFVLSCKVAPSTLKSKSEKLASKYILIDAQRQALARVLKMITGEKGNIQVGGVEVGFHQQIKTMVDYSLLDELEALKQAGIKPQELISFRTRQMTRLAKKLDWLSNYVSYEINPKPRFGIKRSDKKDEENENGKE